MDDASWVRVGYSGIPWELGISDLARRFAFLPSVFLPISLALLGPECLRMFDFSIGSF